MVYDPNVTPTEREQCLPVSIEYPVAPNEFEFALVLGGTGAAGAYTAGVLDFLIEALDCFEANFDSHKVRLKILSSTSGGTVNGAILARTIGMALAPARLGQAAATLAQNVFYDTWVNQLQVSQGLLSTEDNPVSALNGGPIDRAAAKLVGFAGPARPPRQWVPNPLRMILTVANLRGVPYTMDLTGGPESFASYSDFGRFAFDTGNGPRDLPRADEYQVTDAAGPAETTMSWANFAEWAKASAAPPAVFPARPLVRLGRHYAFRGFVDYVQQQPSGLYQANRRLLPVDWDSLGVTSDQDECPFLAVDGGTTDNEPILLARQSLSGWLRQEPRDGVTTRRAILLVDPFSAGFTAGPSAAVPLLKLAGAAIGALRGDALFETADLILMGDPNVYSRFKITPRRPDQAPGEKSAATAGASATMGFFCPAFSMHDFFLGRANCQDYLRNTFVLPMENPLFDKWPAPAKAPVNAGGQMVVDDAGKNCLPIIPLFGSALEPNPIVAWPKGKFDPNTIANAVNQRVGCLLDEVEAEVVPSVLARLGLKIVNGPLDGAITDYVVGLMKADLQSWGL